MDSIRIGGLYSIKTVGDAVRPNHKLLFADRFSEQPTTISGVLHYNTDLFVVLEIGIDCYGKPSPRVLTSSGQIGYFIFHEECDILVEENK